MHYLPYFLGINYPWKYLLNLACTLPYLAVALHACVLRIHARARACTYSISKKREILTSHPISQLAGA